MLVPNTERIHYRNLRWSGVQITRVCEFAKQCQGVLRSACICTEFKSSEVPGGICTHCCQKPALVVSVYWRGCVHGCLAD
mmetsp:Transcript_114861/g.365127  ORF Transcript_114861/g.365127 Transcript_114861/m.365127 type:complete len:80 (+) Transcript_114861:2468-2707(+)